MFMKIFRLVSSLFFGVMGILILLGKYEPSIQTIALVAFMAAANAMVNGDSDDKKY